MDFESLASQSIQNVMFAWFSCVQSEGLVTFRKHMARWKVNNTVNPPSRHGLPVSLDIMTVMVLHMRPETYTSE